MSTPFASRLAPYAEVVSAWPTAGKHIIGLHDSNSIVVYQAYSEAIASEAVAQQRLCASTKFSLSRMTWIKPNFFWMMYRCGYASKVGQERVLAITLTREAFDSILANSLSSSTTGVDAAPIRLQWDPDHDPLGRSVARRAVQLGIRGLISRHFAGDTLAPARGTHGEPSLAGGTSGVLKIEDITDYVRQVGHEFQSKPEREWGSILVPHESLYLPADPAIATHVGLS